MSPHLFEVCWMVDGGQFETYTTEMKVFESEDEAREYGLRKQAELNDGLSPEDKAWDGYYYKLFSVQPIYEIEGYPILVKDKS